MGYAIRIEFENGNIAWVNVGPDTLSIEGLKHIIKAEFFASRVEED